MYLKTFSTILAVSLGVLISLPTNKVQAAPAANFDIPISELTKTRKSVSAKVAERSKKKKRKTAKVQKSVKKNTPYIASVDRSNDQERVKTPSETTKVQIHHTPYSFVTADKNVVIYAVVSSTDEIKSVRCTLGGNEQIQMTKVAGSQYTYKATLPGISMGSSYLRYNIIVVDSSGGISRSNEFSSPVIDTTVIPSWQSAAK